MWRGPWYVPELRVLNLGNNSLTGIIPPYVGNATKLMNFDLSENRVSGNIPKGIGNLSQLTELYLYNNQLTGFIPTTLFNISSLLAIFLGINRLSGPLLVDEGNIVSNFNFLSISYNQISGCIPSNICQLTELNFLSIYFNNITGDIPKNIGCLSNLEKFYIGENPIKGTIPTSLGNISTLQYLYCGNNRIVGQIPPELGKISNLRELSFVHNYNLIGQNSHTLKAIKCIVSINVSFNDLEGEIPSGGVFAYSTLQSFLGNKGLCGMHILEIPACAITNPGKQSKIKEGLLEIVTPVVTSSFLIFLLATIWIMKRQKKGKSKDVEKVPEIRTHQLVAMGVLRIGCIEKSST
ncbi:probable LRR receptor-like serine/threonine-protein kinase At1g34110 [Solanum tuberosum]|uniref:probable LRR receptor-like serine/threonine-protein kinase At1g34110 n=1 Tax=Solanum tuberosum TaxID=4113 RepID=UPI00073A11E8|nr:PREDICTED: probable LRR receptor-like serine/threonine-protein kinase At1g34110 [Solanum tuberosum]